METPLCFASYNDPTLLKQVPIDVCAGDAAIGREANTDKLAETTGVVVSLRLSIAECLEDGICLQDLSLEQTKTALGSQSTEARTRATDRGALGVLA